MQNIETVDLLRGINPNLAAGERCLRLNAYEAGYEDFAAPDNPLFNVGYGALTIFVRVIDLGIQDRINNNGSALFQKYNGTGYSLAIMPQRAGLQFFFLQGGAPCGVLVNRPLPLTGRPFSVALVRTTTSVDDIRDPTKWAIYIDGVAVPDSERGFYPYSSGPFDTPASLTVNGQFRGYYDKFYFYTRALSPDEVAGLDNPATRTDQGAKLILDFNQVGGPTVFDSSSVANHAVMENYPDPTDARHFPKVGGIRTFRPSQADQQPMNGQFQPGNSEKVIGMRLMGYFTDVQYSLNGTTWFPVTFDSSYQPTSTNFPALLIGPTESSNTLYLKATTVNPADRPDELSGIELIY